MSLSGGVPLPGHTSQGAAVWCWCTSRAHPAAWHPGGSVFPLELGLGGYVCHHEYMSRVDMALWQFYAIAPRLIWQSYSPVPARPSVAANSMWTAMPCPHWCAMPELPILFSALLVSSGTQRLLLLRAATCLATVAPLPDKFHQPLSCKLEAPGSSLLLWGFPSLGNLAMHTLGCSPVHHPGTRSAYRVTYQLLSASEQIFRITSKQIKLFQ